MLSLYYGTTSLRLHYSAFCQMLQSLPAEVLTRVQHENLVRLYGVCIDTPPLRSHVRVCLCPGVSSSLILLFGMARLLHVTVALSISRNRLAA